MRLLLRAELLDEGREALRAVHQVLAAVELREEQRAVRQVDDLTGPALR